jgi:hypothetical protein
VPELLRVSRSTTARHRRQEAHARREGGASTTYMRGTAPARHVQAGRGPRLRAGPTSRGVRPRMRSCRYRRPAPRRGCGPAAQRTRSCPRPPGPPSSTRPTCPQRARVGRVTAPDRRPDTRWPDHLEEPLRRENGRASRPARVPPDQMLESQPRCLAAATRGMHDHRLRGGCRRLLGRHEAFADHRCEDLCASRGRGDRIEPRVIGRGCLGHPRE